MSQEMSKTGVTLAIPCHRAQDLVQLIDDFETQDADLRNLADYLRQFRKGLALICVAPEDFVLWPDGPDVRDFQIGGRNTRTVIVHGENVYSNDPDDLAATTDEEVEDRNDERK